MITRAFGLAVSFFLALGIVSAAGCAARGAPGETRNLTLEGRQFAYDRGYTDGFDQGERDASDGLAFDPTRHSRYREARRGYRGSFRNREQYAEVYRQAYEAGYKRGYHGYGRPRQPGVERP